MSLPYLYALAGAGLFFLGLFGLISYDHLLRKILAVNVLGSGVFLMLVGLARRGPGLADPVPHAMVITGIVVAVSATALALVLMLAVTAETGRPALPDEEKE